VDLEEESMPERKNGMELTIVEPVIVCPHCKKEIRLTESLAAPLVEATRRQYEQKLAEKDSEIARREAIVRRQEKAVNDAQSAVDDRIAQGIRKEREKIAAGEAKKARFLVSDELQAKSREVADLLEILKTKDDKLAEAQTARAALVRKQRELAVMHGLRSYARISETLRLILRSWFLGCCPRASTFSITSMASGCSTQNVSFRSRSHFANP
jgi:hypothetical protein